MKAIVKKTLLKKKIWDLLKHLDFKNGVKVTLVYSIVGTAVFNCDNWRALANHTNIKWRRKLIIEVLKDHNIRQCKIVCEIFKRPIKRRGRFADWEIRKIRKDKRPAVAVAKTWKISDLMVFNIRHKLSYKHVSD